MHGSIGGRRGGDAHDAPEHAPLGRGLSPADLPSINEPVACLTTGNGWIPNSGLTIINHSSAGEVRTLSKLFAALYRRH